MFRVIVLAESLMWLIGKLCKYKPAQKQNVSEKYMVRRVQSQQNPSRTMATPPPPNTSLTVQHPPTHRPDVEALDRYLQQ